MCNTQSPLQETLRRTKGVVADFKNMISEEISENSQKINEIEKESRSLVNSVGGGLLGIIVEEIENARTRSLKKKNSSLKGDLQLLNQCCSFKTEDLKRGAVGR